MRQSPHVLCLPRLCSIFEKYVAERDDLVINLLDQKALVMDVAPDVPQVGDCFPRKL